MYQNFISELDVQRFGFKVAKVDDFYDRESEIICELKKLGVRLIISRVSANKLALINSLEDMGFRIKDLMVTYKFNINRFDTSRLPPNNVFKIREVNVADIPALVEIAEASFQGYGHYFADARLDKKKCIEIYKDWVARSCFDACNAGVAGVADTVLVAQLNEEITGFIAYKTIAGDSGKHSVGVIGAVARQYRKQGVFQSLILQGLAFAKERNYVWQEQSALTCNVDVNNTFYRLGFGVSNSFVTLHCWLDC